MSVRRFLGPGRSPAGWIAGLAVVVLASAAAGCANSPTSTDASDNVELLFTKYFYGCEIWTPREPPVRRTVFDLMIPAGSEAEARGRVEAAGGVIRYVFRSRLIVRADFDTAAVVPLAPRGALFFAWTVAKPDDLRITIYVGYDHPATAADMAAVESLGGIVVPRGGLNTIVSYYIDDRQVDAVRALPGVKFAESDSYGCII